MIPAERLQPGMTLLWREDRYEVMGVTLTPTRVVARLDLLADLTVTRLLDVPRFTPLSVEETPAADSAGVSLT